MSPKIKDKIFLLRWACKIHHMHLPWIKHCPEGIKPQNWKITVVEPVSSCQTIYYPLLYTQDTWVGYSDPSMVIHPMSVYLAEMSLFRKWPLLWILNLRHILSPSIFEDVLSLVSGMGISRITISTISSINTFGEIRSIHDTVSQPCQTYGNEDWFNSTTEQYQQIDFHLL